MPLTVVLTPNSTPSITVPRAVLVAPVAPFTTLLIPPIVSLTALFKPSTIVWIESLVILAPPFAKSLRKPIILFIASFKPSTIVLIESLVILAPPFAKALRKPIIWFINASNDFGIFFNGLIISFFKSTKTPVTLDIVLDIDVEIIFLKDINLVIIVDIGVIILLDIKSIIGFITILYKSSTVLITLFFIGSNALCKNVVKSFAKFEIVDIKFCIKLDISFIIFSNAFFIVSGISWDNCLNTDLEIIVILSNSWPIPPTPLSIAVEILHKSESLEVSVTHLKIYFENPSGDSQP